MNNVAERLAQLVCVDSPTGDEERFADYLISLLSPFTGHVQKDGYGNVYARVDGHGDPIFFVAHLDTVEPGRGIKPCIRDGFMTSDGSTILGADNKVAIAVYLCLIEKLIALNHAHKTVEFVFTKSEEIGNFGAINFDYSLLQAKQGFCFDSIAPLGTIITASPFYERIDIQVCGKEAHASKPEEAASVLPTLNKLMSSIPTGRISDTTLCNIGVVTAGSVRNTIPGKADLMIEIRSYVEEDLKQQIGVITGLAHSTNDDVKVHVDHELENPGYYHRSREADSLIGEVELVMQRVGISAQRTDSMAVSDANIFNNQGLLCVNLGDGVEFAHTTKERVAVGDLELLVRLCRELSV